MKKRLAIALMVVLMTFSAATQRLPNDEIGFKAGKLYDFHDLDTVNLLTAISRSFCRSDSGTTSAPRCRIS